MFFSYPANSNEVSSEKLKIRDGESLRILIMRPEKSPEASVILFAGGKGKLGIKADKTIKNPGNFLVRNRDKFLSENFLVAIFDAPSDLKGFSGLIGFRKSEKHGADVSEVIKRLRKITSAPVWLIGHSRGSISATNAASRLAPPAGPDGIILMSSVVITGNKGQDSVHNTNLKSIKVPTLIYHHKSDGCYVTQWSDAKSLEKKLTASIEVKTIGVTGGSFGKAGQECKSNSHHGFKGMLEEAVSQVADWIKSR